ncbi:MAG: hypothetical protein DHS20C20_17480 [Ardenticatenaceae bacterium]|nr:MAG: hypothetical protein DHS20C20_17480 [Ardenticatenaceae bacterium]
MEDTTITGLIILSVLVVATIISVRTIKRIMSGHLQQDAAKQQIINNGIVAQAVVLEVWETGVHIRHKPQLGLHLKISPPNQAPYEAETQLIATPLQLVQLQSGKTISVHIDPNNPQNVVVNFGKSNDKENLSLL